MDNIAHRSVIRYLGIKDLSPKEIQEDMVATLKKDSSTYSMVKKWAAEWMMGDIVQYLFRKDAEILHLFQGFANIQGDALRENETLEAHAMLVMNTLDKAFTNLEKYDFVVDSLMATGATHTRFPGFEDRYFNYMEEPFLCAIKLTLGDRYTDRIENLYKVSIAFILNTLRKGMREAKEQQILEQKQLNENSNHVTTPSPDAPSTAIIVNT